MAILKINLRLFASIMLLSMCIRFVPLDIFGGSSIIELIIILLCPFVYLAISPQINKSTVCLFLYCISVLISSLYNFSTSKFSSVFYFFTFVLFFQTYYNLVFVRKIFSWKYFCDLIEFLLIAYGAILILQQIFLILGFTSFPLINLIHSLDRGLGSNSLESEPSSAARIITAAYLCLLKLHEYEMGRKLTLIDAAIKLKKVNLLFLWSMITMGSGTAFIGLGLISLYFIKMKNLIKYIPIIIIMMAVVSNLNYIPLNRALNIVEAVMTLDKDVIVQTDGSASVRIIPIINTLNIDLFKLETWLGLGHSNNLWVNDIMSGHTKIGIISIYGLLSYILSIIFIYYCCIKKFFSIETLFIIILMGGGVSNISYQWGILLLFSTTYYFSNTKHLKGSEKDGQKHNIDYM